MNSEDVSGEASELPEKYLIEVEEAAVGQAAETSAAIPPAEENVGRRNFPSPEATIVKRRRTDLDVLETSVKELRNITKNINSLSYGDEDECDAFGHYVALQLKKLSAEEQILTQNKIQNILSTARLKQVRH